MITYNNSTTMLFTLIIYYFLTIGQLDNVLLLRVGFSCYLLMHYSVFLFYYILKRMKHFSIPVSVSKADYRRKVIFIAAKTL